MSQKVLTYAGLQTYDGKLKTYIQGLIADAKAGKVVMVSVSQLPEKGEENKIYLVPAATTGTSNVKDEYIWLSTGEGTGSWEKVGTTQADFAGYATESYADQKASAAEQAAKDYADGLAGNYATAAQGAKADSALQPADILAITDAEIEALFA